MTGILWIGLGGGIGAILRYGLSILPCVSSFPLLTLMTNVLGALLIGYVVGMGEIGAISGDGMKFLKTGLCGGFTTFSTFSLESYQMMMDGKQGEALLYALLSVVLCLLGVFLGMNLARQMR